MPKVLISDKLSPHAKKIFSERGIEVDYKVGMSKEELIECIGIYDGLAIRSSTTVTRQLLEAGKELKVIGRAGIGVDNIDVKEATSRGVVVMNTPFGNSITTAEHSLALIFSLARKIPQANSSTHQGKWEKNKFIGVELFGKVLGIIGCGNVGSILADRAIGVKMKVIAFDPYLSEARAMELGVKKVTFEYLCQNSDFISLHTPLTETTKNIINKTSIKLMRDGVRIINCARGGLIVEEDLIEAVESKKVSGAAIDVFTEEPALKSNLFGINGIIATPHLGASTLEAQENVSIQIAEQMSDFLLLNSVSNALNMASISVEEAPKIKPYLLLAEKIGNLLGQIINFQITEVKIDYQGHVSKLNNAPLTSVSLEGILKYIMDSINMVNASYIARESGINVVETHNEKNENYQSLIRVSVKGENDSYTVAGTIFTNNEPRVVEINGIRIEARLEKNMLFITNNDFPGFIGVLGKLLGDAGVNIAALRLGRDKPGGEALSLITIDTSVNNSTLKEINDLSLVNSAILLNFN